MKRSWCWRGLRGGMRGGLQAAALVSLLAGCSLTDSVFGGGSSSTPQPVPGPAAQTQASAQPGAQPAQGQTYPNLGTVPAQAPATTSSADRQQITSGLVADNQNAAYSDQPVTAQQNATPAPIPAPAPVAPAADAGSTGSTPAPMAPAQSEVSQTTINQTTTTQLASQASAVPPAASALPQPVTPPLGSAGATPLAPPPNPIPPAPATGTMTTDQGPVIVDTSQLGGPPLPGYPPAPYSAPIPYGAPVGTLAIAGQPVAIIFFADASAGLSQRDQTVLHDVYLIQQQQGGRLRIVGHASLHTVPLDPARHDQVNDKLSAIRANAVARALIGMGAPEGTISIVAEGSRAPVFYEFMPTGEAGNRRVEIYLDR